MIERHITFCKSSLDDPPDVVAQNVNRIGGRTCAAWIRDGVAKNLPGYVFDSDIIGEDWGWALVVSKGRDTFLIGTHDFDKDEWGVSIGDHTNRGLFPTTRKRRTEAAREIADAVEAFLRNSPGVTGLEVDETAS